MSLLLVEARGWRPLGAHIRVSFRHIPADCTVAFVGPNGAGKSTLLKLLGWAEHGDALVGRGWANERRHPGSAEATIVTWRELADGRLLKIRRRVSKRDTHVFIDAFPAGSELIERDGWVEATGTPETLCSGLGSTAPTVLTALGTIPTALYMAAGAADQGGAGSFFSLTSVDDRRKVIGAACDTERLSPLAKIGEIYRPELRRVADYLAARVEALAAKRVELATVDAALAVADVAVQTAQGAETQQAATLADAESRLRVTADARSRADASLGAARQRSAQVAEAHTAARREWDAAQRVEDVEPLQEMRERLSKARAIHGRQLLAKGTYDANQARLAQAAADLADATAQRARFGTVRHRAAIQADVDVASPVASKLPELLRDVETTKSAAAATLAAHSEFADAPAALARAEAAAKETGETRERLLRQGAFVEQVPCHGETLAGVDCSTCPALADAREAKEAVPGAKAAALEAAGRLSEARRRKQLHDESAERVKVAATVFTQAQTAVATAQAAKSRLDALLAESERLESAERADAAVTRARTTHATATTENGTILEGGRRLRAELAEALRVPPGEATPAAIEALEREIEARATAAVDGGASQLAALEARISDLQRQAEMAQREVEAARVAFDSADAAIVAAATEANAAKRESIAAAADVRSAQLEIARLKGSREPLARDVAALPALEAALTDARVELDDYTLIETGFGPRGVPGLIIDAEGGRIAEDVQEIADVVYGERTWEFDFKTFDPDAARTKQELSDLVIREPGETEWRIATATSPGQGRVLSPAFCGALRRLVKRRTGYGFDVVIHDEQDTGLDVRKQREYIAMLRATGAARHLIVTHNEQVWVACDYRLVFSEDGGVAWET